MNYAFPNFLRRLLGGLVLFLTFGNLRAASFTQGYAGSPPNDGVASLTLSVTVLPVSGNPAVFDLAYTYTGSRTGGSIPQNLEGRIQGVSVASVNNFGTTFSGSGTLVSQVPFVYDGAKRRFVISFIAPGYISEQYYVYPPGEQPCGDLSYDYYLPGTSVAGTRYVVFKQPDNGEPTIIYEGLVRFGATQRVNGTLIDFCGQIRVQKYIPDREDPWQDYTPPSSPPPPPNNAPPPPSPPPVPPDVPDVPAPGPTPPPPSPPSPPPMGGGGGDAELIEWVKDNNTVLRGISGRSDISNEYLKQIRDNTGYASERLKTIDENTQIVADDVKRKAEAEEAIRDAMPDSAEMLEEGSSAAAAATDALGSLAVGTPTISGSPPVFTISMPSQFGGATFDLNPFRADRLGPLCAWLRSFALWLLVVGFAVYAVHQSGDAVRDVAQSQQAKGNAVFAGTGGQATAFIAAGLITAVVLSAIVALVAWKDTVIAGSGASVLSFLVGDPFANAPTQVLWMIDQVFPLATACAVLLAKITFRFAVTLTYLAAASIIRFVVP